MSIIWHSVTTVLTQQADNFYYAPGFDPDKHKTLNKVGRMPLIKGIPTQTCFNLSQMPLSPWRQLLQYEGTAPCTNLLLVSLMCICILPSHRSSMDSTRCASAQQNWIRASLSSGEAAKASLLLCVSA